MDKKSDDHILIVQDTIESNRQDYDEKMKKLTEYFTEMIVSMMDQSKISKSSPDRKCSPKLLDPTTVVPANKKHAPLEGRNTKKLVLLGL